MKDYVVKKILTGIPTIIIITVIIFFTMRLVPGDPIVAKMTERLTYERLEEIRAQWGLDKPLFVQYFYWVNRLLRGDFGVSIYTGLTVAEMVLPRVPKTLLLSISALLLSIAIGIPAGIISAIKQYSIFDYSTTVMVFIWMSFPSFWLGLIFIIFFSVQLNLFPVSGYGGIEHLFLPMLTLSLPACGSLLRLTRSSFLEVIRQDYIMTAKAKGLSERIVMYKHALRNSMLPVVTILFLRLPWLIGGSVIVENVFGWPGMGQLFIQSVIRRDYAVVQAVTLIIAVLTVVSSLLADIVYAWLDPRIRISEEGGR